MDKNIQKQEYEITKEMRRDRKNHSSFILWFTGLSGSGKSTLAREVETELFNQNKSTYVLDGDNIRFGINKDLGFSKEDRVENIRRIGEVSKLFVDSGTIVLSAFISPYQKDRQIVKSLVEVDEFIEVYVKCPLEICESRDVKGLYKKARDGIIKGFTGIDDPYEEPINPQIIVETNNLNIEESTTKIVEYLKNKKLI